MSAGPQKRRPSSQKRRPSAEYWDGFYAAGGTGNGDVSSADLPAALVDAVGDVDGRRVLDIGCGEGHLAIWLAERGASVVAIDKSPSAVEVTGRNAYASGLSEHVEAEVLDAIDLDRLDALFDLVVGMSVLGGMEPFDVFVRSLASVVGAEGRVVFHEPDLAAGADDDGRLDELARRFAVTTHGEVVELRRRR